MTTPLISIVTTLYNYARYITDLANSVLAQSYENWEWIIVDDCSTDNPERELDLIRTGRWSKRVILIRLDCNRGYSFAKNMGIRCTGGQYIVMIDADDMLTPKSLELRYKALSKTDKLWIHGEVQVMDAGRPLSDRSRQWKRNFRKKLIAEGKDLTTWYHHRLIHAQSVMVRRELHFQLGLYDEKLRFSSDNEMWRRIIKFGHIPAHIEDYVAIYRVHDKRMARSPYKKEHGPRVKKEIIADVERRFREGITAENTPLWV